MIGIFKSLHIESKTWFLRTYRYVWYTTPIPITLESNTLLSVKSSTVFSYTVRKKLNVTLNGSVVTHWWFWVNSILASFKVWLSMTCREVFWGRGEGNEELEFWHYTLIFLLAQSIKSWFWDHMQSEFKAWTYSDAQNYRMAATSSTVWWILQH